MTRKYVQPQFELDAFNCPHCDAYSHHIWSTPSHQYSSNGTQINGHMDIEYLRISRCVIPSCHNYALWVDGKMIYPMASNAPLPSEDMPKNVKSDYLEARNVLELSPKSSAALLRLALQKLMIHLGEKGDNLNHDIKELVNKGLSPHIQKALDSVRIYGNESVHPGQLDLNDDRETSVKLFQFVNIIVDAMITQPKEIDAIYRDLPENKIEGIKTRDADD